MRPEIHERGENGKDDREQNAVNAASAARHPQRVMQGRRVWEDVAEEVKGVVRGVEDAPSHHVPPYQ